MVKLFKFMQDGKVIGVTYSDKDGNITPPEGATAVEITEDEKDMAIAQQQADIPPTPPSLEDRVASLESQVAINTEAVTSMKSAQAQLKI